MTATGIHAITNSKLQLRLQIRGLQFLQICILAACETSWFRPGGLICDWWAAVNIHIHYVALSEKSLCWQVTDGSL